MAASGIIPNATTAPIAASQGSQANPILPKVMPVSDGYSKTEIDAKSALMEERLGRAADSRLADILQQVKDASAQSSKDIAVFASDIRGDLNAFKAEMNAGLSRTAGQKTVWGAVGTAVAAILFGVAATVLVVIQVAQNGYDTGSNAEERINEAVQAATPKPLFDSQTGRPIPQ